MASQSLLSSHSRTSEPHVVLTLHQLILVLEEPPPEGPAPTLHSLLSPPLPANFTLMPCPLLPDTPPSPTTKAEFKASLLWEAQTHEES